MTNHPNRKQTSPDHTLVDAARAAGTTERERDLLFAAENVLASWAVVRASSDVLGAASKEMLFGLAASLTGLALACDAYPDEVLALRGETE